MTEGWHHRHMRWDHDNEEIINKMKLMFVQPEGIFLFAFMCESVHILWQCGVGFGDMWYMRHSILSYLHKLAMVYLCGCVYGCVWAY